MSIVKPMAHPLVTYTSNRALPSTSNRELAGPSRLSGAARDQLGIGFLTMAGIVSASDMVSFVFVASGVVLLSFRFSAGLGTPAGRTATSVGAWYLFFGLAVGSLPSEFSSLQPFLAQDGRLLAVMVVLVCALGIPPQRADAVLDVIPIALLIGVGVSIAGILAGVAPVTRDGVFWGLTSSHHVPGYYYGVGILILSTRKRPFTRRAGRLAVLMLFLAVVVASGSRATILGLVLALAAWIVTTRDRATVKRVGVGAMTVILLFMVSARSFNTITSFADGTFSNVWQSGATGREALVGMSAADANVALRFGSFDRALELGKNSPLVGAGPFRYNDVEGPYLGMRGVVHVNISSSKTFNDSSAHNFPLQIFAETGLIGVALFTVLIARLWRRAVRSAAGLGTKDATLCHLVIFFAFGVGTADTSLLSAALGLIAWPTIALAGSASRKKIATSTLLATHSS